MSAAYNTPERFNRSESIQQWWGNTVYQNTVDWNQRPLMELAKGSKFGYVTDQSSSEHR
jgi:hypothetical protein